MPPKKDHAAAGADKLLVGFEDKETKLLAAAFVCCTGPDKYDFDLMAELTGNTNGTLKKMWPPIKKKAIEAYPSFAAFIGNTGAKITAATGEAKPATLATGRKRKVADAEVDPDSDSKDIERKKKAVPAKKGRAVKKSKAEVKDEEDSADGGDGLDPKEIEDEV